MKTIVVCCATSMVTSTVAINKIKEYLAKHGLEAKYIQCKFVEVEGIVDLHHPDLVVPTGALNPDRAPGVPVIKGTSFITGINEEATLEKIKDFIAEEQ